MKKFLSVMLAGAFAIGFSAFTPAPRAQSYYYQTGPNSFATFTGTPCPEATQQICVRNQPGVGNVTVLKSEDPEDKLMYNP